MSHLLQRADGTLRLEEPVSKAGVEDHGEYLGRGADADASVVLSIHVVLEYLGGGLARCKAQRVLHGSLLGRGQLQGLIGHLPQGLADGLALVQGNSDQGAGRLQERGGSAQQKQEEA